MNIWKAVSVCAVVIILALVVVGVAGIFNSLYKEHRERSRKASEMEAAIKAKEEAIGELRMKQELFRTDSNFVESLAREKIGKARPGETIFKFPADAPSPNE